MCSGHIFFIQSWPAGIEDLVLKGSNLSFMTKLTTHGAAKHQPKEELIE